MSLVLIFRIFCVLIILLLVGALSYLQIVGMVGTVSDAFESVLYEFEVWNSLKVINLTLVSIL